MGLLDSLNPFSIGLQIALLPLSRKSHHTLYYILGTFVTYFIGGFVIYFGFVSLFQNFISNFNIDFTKSPYPIIELILGIGLLSYVIFVSLINRQNIEPKKKEFSVKPFSLFILGATGTLFDLPTAIPYIAVLGKMGTMNLDPILAIFLLVFYCIIYLLPMLAIYTIHNLFKGKSENLINKTKVLFDKIAGVTAKIFSVGIAIFLIVDSILSMIGNPIKF